MDILLTTWDEYWFTRGMGDAAKNEFTKDKKPLRELEYLYYHGNFEPKNRMTRLDYEWNPHETEMGILYKNASINMSHNSKEGGRQYDYDGRDYNRLTVVPPGNYTRQEYRKLLLTTQDDDEINLINSVQLIYRIMFLFFLVLVLPLHSPTILIGMTLISIMIYRLLPRIVATIHICIRCFHPFYGSYEDMSPTRGAYGEKKSLPLNEARKFYHYRDASIKPYFYEKLDNFTQEVGDAMTLYRYALVDWESFLSGRRIDREKYFSVKDDKEERRRTIRSARSPTEYMTGSCYRALLITTPSREELVVGMCMRTVWWLACLLFILPDAPESLSITLCYTLSDIVGALFYWDNFNDMRYIFILMFCHVSEASYHPLIICNVLIPVIYMWQRSNNIVYGGVRSEEDRVRELYE